MTRGLVVGIGVVGLIVVVGGGWWLLSATEQADTELAVTATPEITFTPAPVAPGQFIREVPEDAPGVLEAELNSEVSVDSSVAVTSETSTQVTVSMSESGFSPDTITIPVGATLTFVNNGQAPHWPASDVHPTHELLPEFDAKRPLQTGETFSYTFTETGRWTMHDHLAPQYTGVVVVE